MSPELQAKLAELRQTARSIVPNRSPGTSGQVANPGHRSSLETLLPYGDAAAMSAPDILGAAYIGDTDAEPVGRRLPFG